ncbi:hypothetical protein MPTK1_5g10990 [Marchantia polymorpha subsp. ruderalis]|uniref:Uncharacterized protein n=2 Tax=Marchantia polymorpha TaxID=3197 RepID=A0AAF6BH46_MARPO|nr:hypothetical protein MARPO_0093s0021 [Marchantia polymorpha]BBN11330.1 hypothetical protein Mp_5g10990 [Marchantia polymorpha subsp. ruderalis]|eukprot:PTQ32938.1 hypothetical protein MARPO_0093s0021 [Marchantia polymorpha]
MDGRAQNSRAWRRKDSPALGREETHWKSPQFLELQSAAMLTGMARKNTSEIVVSRTAWERAFPQNCSFVKLDN